MQQFLQFAANHPFYVGAAVAMAIAVAIHEFRARTADFGAISPTETVRLMNAGAVVIDIRKREDFEAGHLSGSRHVPGDTIADGAKALERFKDKVVIAVCETGMTGGAAARHLGRLGFTKAYNLRGGIAAWKAENLPVVKDGGGR